jgi:hypothetical protein
MPCPSHSPWLDHSNYTWRRVQVMEVLIMQFLEPPVASSLFGCGSLALQQNPQLFVAQRRALCREFLFHSTFLIGILYSLL